MSQKINIMICGGRDFNNYPLLEKKVLEDLQDYLSKNPTLTQFNPRYTTIISGNARGADTLGEMFARKFGLQIEKHPALWNMYGRRAGFVRNEEMVNISDIVIIFHDGKSKGTAHDLELCKAKNKTYYYHLY